jgi:hypothetical protein
MAHANRLRARGCPRCRAARPRGHRGMPRPRPVSCHPLNCRRRGAHHRPPQLCLPLPGKATHSPSPPPSPHTLCAPSLTAPLPQGGRHLPLRPEQPDVHPGWPRGADAGGGPQPAAAAPAGGARGGAEVRGLVVAFCPLPFGRRQCGKGPAFGFGPLTKRRLQADRTPPPPPFPHACPGLPLFAPHGWTHNSRPVPAAPGSGRASATRTSRRSRWRRR